MTHERFFKYWPWSDFIETVIWCDGNFSSASRSTNIDRHCVRQVTGTFNRVSWRIYDWHILRNRHTSRIATLKLYWILSEAKQFSIRIFQISEKFQNFDFKAIDCNYENDDHSQFQWSFWSLAFKISFFTMVLKNHILSI